MSKLNGFGYLRFRRLIVLVLILCLVSTLFLVTALSFLGFYKSFNAYLGEGDEVVTVYDKQSRTPFTGSIPAFLAEQVSGVNGVYVCSPETLTPCIVNNQSLFVRGILPTAFFQLTPCTLVEGETLAENDLGSVLLGKNLADRLNVKVGDELLVFSTLADRFLELRVAGVFVSHSSMDDEALVQLNVGQWLRFADYNHVTLIRAKINSDVASSEGIYQELAKKAQAQTGSPSASNGNSSGGQTGNIQSIISWLPVNFSLDSLGVKGTQNAMKSYLDRYGVTKEALSVLSVLVFLLCGLTVVAASQTLIRQHSEEIQTLRYVGASRRVLKIDVLFKLLPLSLLACSLGLVLTFFALTWLGSNGYLMVLSHQLIISLDPAVIVLNYVLIAALVAVSVLRSEL